jgi:hypothetical protein
MNAELAGKRLQLLKEASGSLRRVAVLWNARDAVMTNIFSEIQTAAPVLGVTVQPLGVREGEDIDGTIAAMTEERPDALFMITDVLTGRYVRQVLDFAMQHQIPTMFQSSGGVAEGGLMSYAPDFTDSYRRAAYYVDRILKGAKPGDLPVEQPTKFELVVNLKTAKALGITIPPALLMLADKVIEQADSARPAGAGRAGRRCVRTRARTSRSRHSERHQCGGNRLRHIDPDDSEEVNDDSGGTATVVTYREDSVSARDQVWFARDSPLEGDGFEPPVPQQIRPGFEKAVTSPMTV